jgi:hypothetical protein
VLEWWHCCQCRLCPSMSADQISTTRRLNKKTNVTQMAVGKQGYLCTVGDVLSMLWSLKRGRRKKGFLPLSYQTSDRDPEYLSGLRFGPCRAPLRIRAATAAGTGAASAEGKFPSSGACRWPTYGRKSSSRTVMCPRLRPLDENGGLSALCWLWRCIFASSAPGRAQ